MGLSLSTTETAVDHAYHRVRELLARYLDTPEGERVRFVRALRPRSEDYGRVFVEAAAREAEASYAALWGNAPCWPVRGDRDILRVACASAHELSRRSALADLFPGGYRDAAPFLRPEVIWACWELSAFGELGGSCFDGLVLAGDRWCWCPRPWNVLARLGAGASVWVE